MNWLYDWISIIQIRKLRYRNFNILVQVCVATGLNYVLHDSTKSFPISTISLDFAKYVIPCAIILSLDSAQLSCSVVSDSSRPHESQHARPPYPSPTPRVYSNSCPSSWWCNPAISSSVVPFSFCPQFLPASGSFPMSQLFAWGDQHIGVSALASDLPMNTRTDLL